MKCETASCQQKAEYKIYLNDKTKPTYVHLCETCLEKAKTDKSEVVELNPGSKKKKE